MPLPLLLYLFDDFQATKHWLWLWLWPHPVVEGCRAAIEREGLYREAGRRMAGRGRGRGGGLSFNTEVPLHQSSTES